MAFRHLVHKILNTLGLLPLLVIVLKMDSAYIKT